MRRPFELGSPAGRDEARDKYSTSGVPCPSLLELPGTWRREAAARRRFGPDPVATALDVCARDLEAALHNHDDVPLTLTQAASESGYSEDHLERQVREGKIPNAGRPNAPRVRRGDLPRKPVRKVAGPTSLSYDPAADARSLLAGRLHDHGGAHGE
jgi:hypothetical protein